MWNYGLTGVPPSFQTVSGPGATLPVVLRAGQVLYARVLDVAQQRAAVQIGSVILYAQLETGLTKGQRVWLRVEEEGPPVRLKIVAVDKKGSGDHGESPVALWQTLGVKSQKGMRKVIDWAIDHHLPLDPKVLQLLQRLENGRYVSPQGYSLALHWRSEAGLEMELLPILLESFQTGNFAQVAERWLRCLESSPGQRNRAEDEELWKWAEILRKEQAAARDNPLLPSSYRLDHIWQRLSLALAGVKQEGNLPRVLPFLWRASVEPGAAEGPSASRSLWHQLLTQVLMQQPFSDESSYYWQFPLPFLLPEMQGNAMLKVPYKETDGTPKEGCFHFAAQLQLVRLGELTVEVQAFARSVSIQLSTVKADDSLQQQVQQWTPHLAEVLRGMGYRLTGIHLRQREEGDASSFSRMRDGIDLQV